MKSLITTLIAASFCLTSGIAEKVVNVYSYRHYEADAELFKLFTQKTGIKVNVVKSKADALMERLKAEGNKSPADLILTSDAARLVRAKKEGLLQAGSSETLLKQVPQNLRDPDNNWFAMTVRARIIAYAKDRVQPNSIKNYADLTKPEWKGRIIARSSSNIYNQSLLASMIANQGKREALTWALKVRKNMARAPQGSDRDQLRAVVAGVADAAIVNTYYIGLLANSEDPKDVAVAEKIGVCFPDQEGAGTHINISGAGICKNAPNKEHAIQLLEFLTSDIAQKTFPIRTSEFPLSMEPITPLLKSWGAFKADPLNLSKLGDFNADAAKVFTAAKWE